MDKAKLRRSLACLREGTEVLRTGGGTSLTAEQCNLLLDAFAELQRARDVCAEIEQTMDAALHKPAWPIDPCVTSRRLAGAEKATLDSILS